MCKEKRESPTERRETKKEKTKEERVRKIGVMREDNVLVIVFKEKEIKRTKMRFSFRKA